MATPVPTGLEKMLGMDMAGIQGIAGSVLTGLSSGIQAASQSKIQAINSEYSIHNDRIRAQAERNALTAQSDQVQDASLQKQQAVQIQAMQAKGSQNVANATTGTKGTSADDIKNAGDLSRNVQLQAITSQNEAVYANLNRQRQTIDYNMERAEVMHKGNKKLLKDNAKWSIINSIIQGGASGYMNAKTLGLTKK